MNNLINEIVKLNCELLSIQPPKIRVVDPRQMPTLTTKCATASDGKEIIINSNFASSKDNFFVCVALSHECRHVWQILNSYNMFDDYKQSDKLAVKNYNEQAAEVDAWAWATMITTDLFKARPNLEPILGKDLSQKVLERAKQISEKKIY